MAVLTEWQSNNFTKVKKKKKRVHRRIMGKKITFNKI